MTPITIADINKYITTIRINFENAYKTQNEEERQMLYRTWYSILKEYPKEVCDRAVIEAIKHAKFAPRIGDIVEQIDKMKTAYEKTTEELWAELTGVFRDVLYWKSRFFGTYITPSGLTQGEIARQWVDHIYDNLSVELKEYVRNKSTLIELAEYTDEQLSYERGRFIRVMPVIKERAKTRQALPDNVAGILQGLNVFVALDGDNHKLIEKGE